jgi:hypothetical protein
LISLAVTLVANDAIVTLLEIEAVTEPIWAVLATRAGREPSDTGRLVALASEVFPMAWIPE